jgi:hypothetical protein
MDYFTLYGAILLSIITCVLCYFAVDYYVYGAIFVDYYMRTLL